MRFRRIEILEKDKNKKGDLFGRLMCDFFHALGYDEPRINISKTGREVDLQATHRIESKCAIAECKAHRDLIGGADINKFVGVFDAEQSRLKKYKESKQLTGYFISISGFKESAIEQEVERGNDNIILIEPEKIIEELIKGRVLVSIENAISVIYSKLKLLEYCDLLATQIGWIWAIYFSDNDGQSVTHFSLIHADGKKLVTPLANDLISIDKLNNKIFSKLKLIDGDKPHKEGRDLNIAKDKYFNYLKIELGEIHFEGLPTDKESGAIKVNLENIFVPLSLSINKDEAIHRAVKRESIGEILNSNPRIAILAKPGSGKSTLLKRIAIAYAFPERRSKIDDKLPDKNWFPIFLRCRELGDKVGSSITEIIKSIPTRAEIESISTDFSILVSESLQNGNALLLIDGLDEISDDSDRIKFVNQLRTFIATYPSISLIVTSRQAGFRIVANSLANYCTNYNVSSLNNIEIKLLCLKWHRTIVDNTENTIREANKLSDLILSDDRILALAENPLLLTTLLFVKRWAGYLPTKRTVLYQEMIKLLLVTWNVEGHQVIDIDEAEPQLCFVAYSMTKNGQQTITSDELKNLLIESRSQMPAILGYTNINPAEFIKKVESRSSLLIMTGHKKMDSGEIVAIYEFLHLSFQEYLTAKAFVKKYFPFDSMSDMEIIKFNLFNENWKEVIPLIAVLLERDSKNIIEFLIEQFKEIKSKRYDNKISELDTIISLLGNCIANEVQIAPDLLGIAIETYARNQNLNINKQLLEIILKNKYSSLFKEKVRESFFKKFEDASAFSLSSILAEIGMIDYGKPESLEELLKIILEKINCESKEDKCIGILMMMQVSFEHSIRFTKKVISFNLIESIFSAILIELRKNDKHLQFVCAWCTAWAGESLLVPQGQRFSYIDALLNIWFASKDKSIKSTSAWALCKVLTPDYPKSRIKNKRQLKLLLEEAFTKKTSSHDELFVYFMKTVLGESVNSVLLFDFFKNRTMFLGVNKEPESSIRLFANVWGIDISNRKSILNFGK